MALFSCHPKVLADALLNAVILGNGTGNTFKPNRNSCPYVYLVYQDSEDGSHGVVAVYGSGRHTSGRALFHLDGQAPGGSYVISLTAQVAKELQSKLRSSPIGVDVTAAIEFYDEPELDYTEEGEEYYADFCVIKEGLLLADLGNADEDHSWEWSMDITDKPMAVLGEPVEGPLLLAVEDLKRLSSLTSDARVIDFIKTGYKGAIAFKAGSSLVGVVGEVDPKLYVKGGGSSEHLFTRAGSTPTA